MLHKIFILYIHVHVFLIFRDFLAVTSPVFFPKRVANDAAVPWNFPSFAPLVPETLALDRVRTDVPLEVSKRLVSSYNPNMGVSKNRGTPKWMVKIMENPIKIDNLGVPLFLEIPIYPICK